jgi:tetratricopeptide (TPR) repeat protein
MGAHGLARRWFARARAATEADEYARVEVSLLEVSVLVGLSRFQEAQAVIDENIERAVRIQHRKGEAYLYSIRGLIHWYLADLREVVPPMVATLDGVGRASSDGPALIPSIAIFLALRGAGERGLSMLEEGWPHVLPSQGIVRRTMTAGRVLVLERLGRQEEALRWAREMLSWGNSPGDIPALCQFVFTGLCEATLAAARSARTPEDLTASMREVQRSLRAFSAWARLYPVGRPELLRYRGLLEQLRGRGERAQALLEDSVRLAQTGGQRLHEALGELALGGLELLPFEARRAHLHRARALLEDSGMSAHLRQVDDALTWLGN